MNHWLITAQIGDRIEYEIEENNKNILNDYLIHSEIRRCFKTIWTNTKIVEDKKLIFIEHISKEEYEKRLKDNIDNQQDFQVFLQSVLGFTKLIHYLRDNYRKPIIG